MKSTRQTSTDKQHTKYANTSTKMFFVTLRWAKCFFPALKLFSLLLPACMSTLACEYFIVRLIRKYSTDSMVIVNKNIKTDITPKIRICGKMINEIETDTSTTTVTKA